MDTIRREYGSLDELHKKFEMNKLKEDKINDLLDSLEHTMKSSENQLSCYRCMNILTDPVILSPCAHAVCKDCSKTDKCPQCSKDFKKVLPCELIQGVVSKFELTKSAVDTFKN